jgi:hypothetical protein
MGEKEREAAAYRNHGSDSFFVHVARLLEERLPNKKVGERAPEVAGLIGEGAEAGAQDGLDA